MLALAPTQNVAQSDLLFVADRQQVCFLQSRQLLVRIDFAPQGAKFGVLAFHVCQIIMESSTLTLRLGLRDGEYNAGELSGKE